MDSYNTKNLFLLIGEDKTGTVKRLLDFSSRPKDIANPWYTGNFNVTYEDIVEGCEALLNFLWLTL